MDFIVILAIIFVVIGTVKRIFVPLGFKNWKKQVFNIKCHKLAGKNSSDSFILWFSHPVKLNQRV